jgi:hypothetical protein
MAKRKETTGQKKIEREKKTERAHIYINVLKK